MARTTRIRSRSFLVRTGTRIGTWNGTTINQTDTSTNSENCTDQHGRPITDGAFSLERYDRSNFKGFNGTAEGPQGHVTHTNTAFGWQRAWVASHLSTGAPSSTGQGATVLSRSNPSRPTIVPLGIVQDLYDLPKMLREVGKLARTPKSLLNPREAANQHLAARFGWLPLIHDVNTLLHVGTYIDQRKMEIDKLYSGEGLRRRIRLGEGHASSGSTTTWESDTWFSPNVRGNISIDTEEKLWGTVRWKPNSTPGHNPSDSERLRLAIQTVSGLTPEGVLKGAWDLLPWSWMVDWFSNVGDWLTQSSSTIPASPTNVCIMRTQVTVGQGSIIQKPKWLMDGGGVGVRTNLSRSIQTGSLTAHLPTLDGGRLSVLGSLFVQRFKHRTFNF